MGGEVSASAATVGGSGGCLLIEVDQGRTPFAPREICHPSDFIARERSEPVTLSETAVMGSMGPHSRGLVTGQVSLPRKKRACPGTSACRSHFTNDAVPSAREADVYMVISPWLY